MVEIQDIFRQYGQSYREQHALPPHVIKAMKAIESCRTAELGAHADVREDCGNMLCISYNTQLLTIGTGKTPRIWNAALAAFPNSKTSFWRPAKQ